MDWRNKIVTLVLNEEEELKTKRTLTPAQMKLMRQGGSVTHGKSLTSRLASRVGRGIKSLGQMLFKGRVTSDETPQHTATMQSGFGHTDPARRGIYSGGGAGRAGTDVAGRPGKKKA